jgi:hypothetical protein
MFLVNSRPSTRGARASNRLKATHPTPTRPHSGSTAIRHSWTAAARWRGCIGEERRWHELQSAKCRRLCRACSTSCGVPPAPLPLANSATPRRHRPRPRMQTRRAGGAAATPSILALTWRPRCERARVILLFARRRGPCAQTHRAAPPRPHMRAARGRQPPVLGVRAPVQRSSSSSSSASSAAVGTTVTIVVVVITAEDCAASWPWGTDAGPAGATTSAAATCTLLEGAPRGCCGARGGGGAAREEGVVSRGVDINLGLEERRFSIHG